MMYRKWLKQLLDFFIAIFLLIISSPLVIIVSLLLFIGNRGTPFFTQVRIGKNNRPFTLFKFRTMNNKVDETGKLLPDEKRLTMVGRLVRKTSMDEIPQLVNIILGNMSLIGPRPLLPEYLPFYNEIQARRHAVKPGITGWAQVNGRNAISWEEKFSFDVEYVDRLSFSFDCKIIFKTVLKVLKSEGISAEGHATMPMFSEYIKNKRAHE